MKARTAGFAAIAFGIAFNIPYAILTATFDYPQVLRGPAGGALTLFAAGGPALILTWYAFMFAALLFVPLSTALAITPARLAATPALAMGAAASGALAGLAQAIGLSRWVFVVPQLAREYASDPISAPAASRTFAMLNAFGGVAVGEHIGQLLTASFVAMVALMQLAEGRRRTGSVGIATAVTLAIGTGEGLALALGGSGEAFSMATIAGFLGLTGWLIATGCSLVDRERRTLATA